MNWKRSRLLRGRQRQSNKHAEAVSAIPTAENTSKPTDIQPQKLASDSESRLVNKRENILIQSSEDENSPVQNKSSVRSGIEKPAALNMEFLAPVSPSHSRERRASKPNKLSLDIQSAKSVKADTNIRESNLKLIPVQNSSKTERVSETKKPNSILIIHGKAKSTTSISSGMTTPGSTGSSCATSEEEEEIDNNEDVEDEEEEEVISPISTVSKRSLKYSTTLAQVVFFDQESAPSDICDCPTESIPDDGSTDSLSEQNGEMSQSLIDSTFPSSNPPSFNLNKKSYTILETNFKHYKDLTVNNGYQLLPGCQVSLLKIDAVTKIIPTTTTDMAVGSSIPMAASSAIADNHPTAPSSEPLCNACIFNKREIYIEGSILVANKCFEKEVKLMYTLDSWVTKRECVATYSRSLNSAIDIFDFRFLLSGTKNIAKVHSLTLEFCISAKLGNQQFWDNNLVRNYVLTVGRVMWLLKKDAEALRRRQKQHNKEVTTIRDLDKLDKVMFMKNRKKTSNIKSNISNNNNNNDSSLATRAVPAFNSPSNKTIVGSRPTEINGLSTIPNSINPSAQSLAPSTIYDDSLSDIYTDFGNDQTTRRYYNSLVGVGNIYHKPTSTVGEITSPTAATKNISVSNKANFYQFNQVEEHGLHSYPHLQETLIKEYNRVW